MLIPLSVILLATQLASGCIPSGGSCNCQQNPSCGQCAPPIQQCCSFSSDPSSFGQVNSGGYVAPRPEIPTANNQYPQSLQPPQQFSQQQPVAIPIVQASESPGNNNYMNEKDQEMDAIAEYNAKERMNFPFPGESSTKKAFFQPGSEPPADEYGGLPAVYFTMRPKTNPNKPSEEGNTAETYDLSSPQRANISLQTTKPETTTATSADGYGSAVSTTDSARNKTTTDKPSHAYAFASGTYWAVLEERETDDGVIHQRRIPYHAYEREVCTGATLGRSIEKDVEAAAIKCTMIGCAAVNIRPIFEDQYEAVYLKNVNVRRQIRGKNAYSCVTIVDVPEYESVYQKKEKEIQKELENQGKSAHIRMPPRLRFVNVEPKAIHN